MDVLFGIFPDWKLKEGPYRAMYYIFLSICHVCLFAFLLSLPFLLIDVAILRDPDAFKHMLPLVKYWFDRLDLLGAIILLFVALGCGVSAYNFREQATKAYGWTEILVGVETSALGFASFSNSTSDKADSAGLSLILSVIGGVYVVVRGCDNINKAAQKGIKSAQKRRDDAEMLVLETMVESASSAAKAANAAAEAVLRSADAAKRAMAVKVLQQKM